MTKSVLVSGIQRILAAIILLSSVLFIAPSAFSAPAAQTTLGTCTYTITPDVTVVDGQSNYSQVKPGDILCLLAGTRPDLKIMNLNGSAGSPITFINSGGKVFITGEAFLNGGIEVINSTYIHITGAGVVDKCGSPYPDDQQQCGIEIGQVIRGIKLTTDTGVIGNIEIDHVYVHDTSTATDTRGIAIHPINYQLVDGISVHHNWVTTTGAEGIYLGTEPHNQSFDVLGKIKNVNVSYNRVENTGYDGIKLKEAVENVSVNHNIVLAAALAGKPNHLGGIKMALSVGDYYDNFVDTGCEGISMGRFLDSPGTRYFNNVVVGAQCNGITVPEDGAQVFNNTIIGSGPVALSVTGHLSQVFDNVIAGSTGTPWDGIDKNFQNNWIGTIADAGFVNPDANDYHLQPYSPFIGMGRNSGIFPATDMDGISRPVGGLTDLGAYEFPTSHDTYIPMLFTGRP